MTEQQLTAMEQALYVIEAWDRDCERSDYWRDIEDTIIALRQALAAEQKPAEGRDWSLLEATQESLREHMAEIKRLRELLEQQAADEPVAYMSRNSHGGYSFSLSPQFFDNPEPLYTRSAERKFEETSHQPAAWVELTDEEIDLLINGRGDEDDDDYVEPTGDGFGVTDADLKMLVHRADAKLRELNGGGK